jgi:hypothetical protein
MIAMITPGLQGFFSSDVENLNGFRPSSLADIYFPLELSIGVKGEKAADLFQILVTSPEALRKRAKTNIYGPGRHCLIVFEYDWPAIKAYLEELVLKCAADTWEEVTQKLSRYFHWEYEDYVREE